LLEIGCGVGAVLAVLGQEHPWVQRCGVDLERGQLDDGGAITTIEVDHSTCRAER